MRRILAMLLAASMLLTIAACGAAEPDPTDYVQPTIQSDDPTVPETEPEDALDEELAGMVALGLCTEDDLEHLDDEIDALTFYDLLLESVRCNQIEPVAASIERRKELDKYPIERMEAATWLFFVVLENYFGEDLSDEPWNYGAYDYASTMNSYANRCGEALACMEHKLFNEGDMDAGWSWGVTYCAIQMDPYSMNTIMEVDEEGYFRSKEILTREEALRAIYRTYRSYLFSEQLTLDEIEPLVLTPQQQAKANQMPDATYHDLPAWRGIALDNKTFFDRAHHSSSMFTLENFEILQDLGFDFSRLFITHKLLYDLTDGVRIDSKHLYNLDAAVGYAIENGVHICICLYDFPGFAGASMEDAGFYDAELLADICDAYAFLAKRYQNVPNSVLSFNLFNEPWMITKEEEPKYVDAVHTVSDTIWEYNKDRLIFVDGIAGSQEPVESLAGEPYAQAFHMYGPEQFIYCNWVEGAVWYQGQQWPLPYANGMLGDGRTLTLQGSFPAGTRVELLLVGDCVGNLDLIADGATVASLQIADGEIVPSKEALLGTLETAAEELVLQWGGEGFVQFESIAVIYPEVDEEGTPLKSSPWVNAEEIRHEMVYEKMTVIYCDAWCIDSDESSTLILAEDGTYSNPGQAELRYDQEYLRNWLKPWLEFRQKSGNEIMIQEWGMVDIISDEGGRAYLKDWVELFNLYEIPWNKWGEVLNTDQVDVEYEQYRGYVLNRKMMEALMIKDAAKEAP